jgi:hypothetical protein
VEAAKREYQLFNQDKRVERVQTRLDRVQHFITYLKSEECRERERYGLDFPDDELFTHKCEQTFDSERKRVLASAAKQSAKRQGSGKRRTHEN